jgi:hypothetical protein
MRYMGEGIEIVCKKGALQWMMTEKPYALINDAETRQQTWGEPVSVPLVPNTPHKVMVAFPYLGKKACMPATIQVIVRVGEVQRYRYKTASTVFSPGKIEHI